jgi:large subunit ribosomal protein L31
MPAYFLAGPPAISSTKARCPARDRVAALLARSCKAMKAEIHPQYAEITATCSCGNVIKTRSTLCEDIHIDVCSQCHPFFTGKQKIVDSGGRVDRFKKRFGNRGAKR